MKKKLTMYGSPFHFAGYVFERALREGNRNVTGYLEMPIAFRKLAAPSGYAELFWKHLLGPSIFVFLPLGAKLTDYRQGDIEALATKALHHSNRHSGIWWYEVES